MILWIPYYVFFVWLTATVIPITNPADKVPPATGLILIYALFVYPCYIAIINTISKKEADEEDCKEGTEWSSL